MQLISSNQLIIFLSLSFRSIIEQVIEVIYHLPQVSDEIVDNNVINKSWLATDSAGNIPTTFPRQHTRLSLTIRCVKQVNRNLLRLV